MAVLAGGAAVVWLVLHAAPGAPGVVAAVPLASLTGALGAGRWSGRPLVTWAWLAGRFALRTRQGGGTLLAAEDAGADGGLPASPEPVPVGSPGGSTATPPPPPPDDEPPWARWLREGGATRPAQEPRPAAEPAPAWRLAPNPHGATLDPYGSLAPREAAEDAGRGVEWRSPDGTGAVNDRLADPWAGGDGDGVARLGAAAVRREGPTADPDGTASVPSVGGADGSRPAAASAPATRGLLGRLLAALRGTPSGAAAHTGATEGTSHTAEPQHSEAPDPPFAPADRRTLADRVVERGRIVDIDRTPLVLMPSPLEATAAPAPAVAGGQAPGSARPSDVDGPEDDDDDGESVLLHLARHLDDELGQELDEELMLELADPDGRSAAPAPPRDRPAAGRAGGAPAPVPVFLGAARRICFFSLNGGVGRTTLATEVGALLAARGRHRTAPDDTEEPLRVALVDLDLLSSNVAIRLGIPQPTLWDYLLASGEDADDVSRFMVRHSSGLHALLGPPKPLSTASTALEPARVAELVHQLERDGFQFLIFDTSGDLGAVTTWVLSAVHDIYVVITDTSIGLQDAYRTTETLRRLGLGHKLRYVVNRSSNAVGVAEVMGDLRGRVCATIPADRRIEEAENEHRIAALTGGGPGADAIARLAQTIYPALGSSPRRRLLRRRRAG